MVFVACRGVPLPPKQAVAKPVVKTACEVSGIQTVVAVVSLAATLFRLQIIIHNLELLIA